MSTQNHNPLPGKRQTTSPERAAAIACFWDKYITIIHDKGIKEPFDRWFVIRARHYIDAFPDKRLAQHNSTDLSGYLEVLGRKGSWQAWQFKQAVDAIEWLLREMVHLPWVDSFDWQQWRSSAKALSDQHPTVAREMQTDAPLPSSEIALTQQQAELMARMKAEIRRRGYSIRTEQTYISWAERYIGFHQGYDPAELDMSAISSFLEYLAVSRNVSTSTQNQALNALVFLYKQVLQKIQKIGDSVFFSHFRGRDIYPDKGGYCSACDCCHFIHQIVIGAHISKCFFHRFKLEPTWSFVAIL